MVLLMRSISRKKKKERKKQQEGKRESIHNTSPISFFFFFFFEDSLPWTMHVHKKMEKGERHCLSLSNTKLLITVALSKIL